MGYDLSGGLSLNAWGWEYCFALAQAFGWKPEGTEAPNHVIYTTDGREECRIAIPPEEWNGSYFTNEFQWVRASDALALSVAINSALEALRLHAANLTTEQADALRELPEGHVGWLEEVGRYFAQRAKKGGFAIY
jgi:hypothetical protein